MKHELKTWPGYFDAIKSGRKTFEIRQDDRGFKVGDTLELQEFIPCTRCDGSGRIWDNGDKTECLNCGPNHGKFTGQTHEVRVTYITDFCQPPRQVVMAIVNKTQ